MTKPQQPELRRSGRGSTDEDSATTKAQVDRRAPVDEPGPTGRIPEDNRPGHHPEHEQDQPDPARIAERFGIVDEPGEGGEER
jgi:hypothetical protein